MTPFERKAWFAMGAAAREGTAEDRLACSLRDRGFAECYGRAGDAVLWRLTPEGEAAMFGFGTAEACLTELRSAGWSVAVHNDYRLRGEAFTFWLFTRQDGRWIKGEGRTDTEALAAARLQAEASAG